MTVETIYCKGGPLDGQLKTVAPNTNHFNVVIKGVDCGNGPQDLTSHYERTTILVSTSKGDVVVFYSNCDWDR